MKNKKMPKLLLVFSILIIAFQHNYCSAQIQTIASTKSIKYRNWDITLNGKVKSIMIITHWPDYSCDTIKPIFDKSYYDNIPSGAIVLLKCKSDTLIYYFDQSLLLLGITKISYYVNQSNIRNYSKEVYKFENGLLKSEISEGDRFPISIKSYTYDSNNNLIFTKENDSYSEFTEYYEYNNTNNLVSKNQYRFYPNYDLSPKLLNSEFYEYDAFGHLIKEEWGENRADFFKYDSLGNKIEEGYGYCSKRRKYNYTPSQGFVYDSKNRLIKSFSIGKFSPHNTDSYYVYDKEGREIDVKGYYITKDTVLGYHLTKEYNEKGELIKEESKIGSGTSFSPKYIECKKKITSYDNYGNITQIELYNCNQFKVKIYRYVYTYDSYGNWIKREEFEGESENTLERIQIEDRIIEYY